MLLERVRGGGGVYQWPSIIKKSQKILFFEEFSYLNFAFGFQRIWIIFRKLIDLECAERISLFHIFSLCYLFTFLWSCCACFLFCFSICFNSPNSEAFKYANGWNVIFQFLILNFSSFASCFLQNSCFVFVLFIWNIYYLAVVLTPTAASAPVDVDVDVDVDPDSDSIFGCFLWTFIFMILLCNAWKNLNIFM